MPKLKLNMLNTFMNKRIVKAKRGGAEVEVNRRRLFRPDTRTPIELNSDEETIIFAKRRGENKECSLRFVMEDSDELRNFPIEISLNKANRKYEWTIKNKSPKSLDNPESSETKNINVNVGDDDQ